LRKDCVAGSGIQECRNRSRANCSKMENLAREVLEAMGRRLVQCEMLD